MLLTISPDEPEFFRSAMTKAWDWTQQHKAFYCDSGGYQLLDDYLAEAVQPERKHLGIVCDGALRAVITVVLQFEGIYEIHVTASCGVRSAIILSELLSIRGQLFEKLYATEVWTSCATVRGHINKASQRLAENCGMLPNGVEWQSERDPRVIWREYFINREMYYGRKETDND